MFEAPEEWPRALAGGGPEGEAAASRLHGMLLAVARREVRRRGLRRSDDPELDDLAHQAADDALLAIERKLPEFRGESRFTTWAHRFVALEVAAKLGRHLRRGAVVSLESEDLERLPDRFGLDPSRRTECRDLLAALRRAVEEDLTERQRRVFVAVALRGVAAEALAAELGASRGAVHKAMFDARRKLRAGLAAQGYLDGGGAGGG